MERKSSCCGAVLATLACLSISHGSTAAPSISSTSGALLHGNSVTISGSGFGTKATAAPLKWETFEDGVAGTNVTTTGYWSVQYSTEDNVVFDNGTYNSTRHSESDMHVRWIRDSRLGASYSFYRENVGFASTRKAYVNLWVYIDYGAGDDDGWQLKMMYLHKDSLHSSKPMFSLKAWTYDSHTTSQLQWHYCDDGTYGYTVYTMYGDASMMPEGHWVNLVMEYMDSSAPDVADGFARFYHSDALGSDPYCVGTKSGITTRCEAEGVTGYVNCLSMGYLVTNGGASPEATTYWDDVYMDNSWARVEIGDASTYANCKHREMQIPTAWSAGSVEINVNQGSFADGQNCYLYVVDESGVMNPTGYPLTVGEVKYQLEVTNGSGSGLYDADQVVGIQADQGGPDRIFGRWVGDVANVADTLAETTTITMPANDVSVTATYRLVYQLTVSSGTGEGKYPAGEVVEIVADPAPSGLEFDCWTGDIAYVAETLAASTTITMPSLVIDVTATYAPAFVLGDISGDGFVGQDDLDLILGSWGNTVGAGSQADPSADGFVGQSDLDIVLDNWGAGSQ